MQKSFFGYNPFKMAYVILLFYSIAAWSSTWKKSTTFDEVAYLTGGYSYWVTGDYRIHPENGVLPQRWVSLPLLLQNTTFPPTTGPLWWHSNIWDFSRAFFYGVGNNPKKMLWWSRGMVVVLGLALGGIIFVWSRRLFGPVGAIISLFLFAFSPSCLAHSALATSDLAVTLAFTASVACIWTALNHITFRSVFVSSLAMGLLFVCKMSAVLILPLAFLLLAIRLSIGRPLIVAIRKRRIIVSRWEQLRFLTLVTLAHAAISIGVIWLCYGFQFSIYREFEPGREQMYFAATIDALVQPGLIGNTILAARDYRLLPEPFLHGFALIMRITETRVAFFNGEFSTVGWKLYFPYCFLVKTPLPTFAVLLSALVALPTSLLVRNGSVRRNKIIRTRISHAAYRTLPIWLFLFLYWGFAIFSHINIGERYLLPTYPMVFVLAGAAGYWFQSFPRRRIGAFTVSIAMFALAIESLSIYPHYLAYFNPIAGGSRHAHRHLVDSSLDWGQDLENLAVWLRGNRVRHRIPEPVYLSYFGSADPNYYGMNVIMLPSYLAWRPRENIPFGPGTYCISATMLQCVYHDPHGPWSSEYEKEYRELSKQREELIENIKQNPKRYQQLASDGTKNPELERIEFVFSRFDDLRFAKLCAFLRGRDPDEQIGYSILVYTLDESDLRAAAESTVTVHATAEGSPARSP